MILQGKFKRLFFSVHLLHAYFVLLSLLPLPWQANVMLLNMKGLIELNPNKYHCQFLSLPG